MRVLFTLLFLLVTSPAHAGSPCTDPPIPRFGELAERPSVVYLPPASIRRICDPNYALRYVFACADEVANTIYLTDRGVLEELGWSDRDIRCLLKHEKAHLWHADGTRWPGDHR